MPSDVFEQVRGLQDGIIHRPGCVTTCCYHEWPGSLTWRANDLYFAGYRDM